MGRNAAWLKKQAAGSRPWVYSQRLKAVLAKAGESPPTQGRTGGTSRPVQTDLAGSLKRC